MLEKVKQYYSQIEPYLHVKKPWDTIIILILNILIAIPLFIVLHQNLIDLEWPFQLDRILIFIELSGVSASPNSIILGELEKFQVSGELELLPAVLT